MSDLITLPYVTFCALRGWAPMPELAECMVEVRGALYSVVLYVEDESGEVTRYVLDDVPEHEALETEASRTLAEIRDRLDYHRDFWGRIAYAADPQGRAVPIHDMGPTALVVGWCVATRATEDSEWVADSEIVTGPLVELYTPDGGMVRLDLSGAGVWRCKPMTLDEIHGRPTD